MILLPIFVSVTNKTKFMPEICRFFGIIIFLYWKDHNPPHIHFTYGDYECSISVLDRIVDGQAPAKVIAKVNEWINLHEAEILSLWEKAQKGEKIDKIEPLKQTLMLRVIDVDYIRNYELLVTFSDGSKKIVNLEPYLTGEVFGELLDKEKFVQYGLTRATIEWANGADLAPEFLYEIGIAAYF